MRTSIKKLLAISEKCLPAERQPEIVFTFEGGRKKQAVSASELFSECAENGFGQYGTASVIEGTRSKLADILCQLINDDGSIPIMKKTSQIY